MLTDPAAGTVTIAGTFSGAPADAENGLPDLTLRCGKADLSIEWQIPLAASATGTGSARLDGFEGSVDADGQVIGNRLTFTFSHAAFRDQDFECFDDDAGDTHYFAGYSPREKAAREPTYLTVGPYGTYDEDKLYLRSRPARFGL